MSGGHWGGVGPVSVPLTGPGDGREPERAAHFATEALELWLDRPLGDLDGWDSGRIEAARLEELRREAEEL